MSIAIKRLRIEAADFVRALVSGDLSVITEECAGLLSNFTPEPPELVAVKDYLNVRECGRANDSDPTNPHFQANQPIEKLRESERFVAQVLRSVPRVTSKFHVYRMYYK